MIALRRAFLWLCILAGVGLAWGAWSAYQFWVSSDEILRAAIVEKLHEIVPEGWSVELGSAGYDFRGRVRLTELELFAPDDPLPVVAIPDVTVTLDREQLHRDGSIVVRDVRAWRPKLRIQRGTDGEWNLAGKWRLPKEKSRSLPSWELEQAELSLEAPPLAPVHLAEAQIVILSEGREGIRVSASGALSRGGVIRLDGQARLDGRDFDVSGRWSGALLDKHFIREVQMAKRNFLPSAATSLSQTTQETTGYPSLDRLIEQFSPSDAAAPAGPIDTDEWSPELNVDWDFSIRKSAQQPDVDARLLATIHAGAVRHNGQRVLGAVQGQLYADRQVLQARNLVADTPAGHVQLDADFTKGNSSKITLAAKNIAIDDDFEQMLPPKLKAIVTDLHLRGVADADVTLTAASPTADWRHDVTLTAKGCRFAYQRFPFPIERLTGTLTLRDGDLQAAMEGTGGGRAVEITGYAKNVGPETEAVFEARGRQLAVDRLLIESAPPAIREVIEDLSLRGHFDVHFRLVRRAGAGQEFEPQLAARTADASMEFSAFPYRITDLSGTAVFVNGVWKFTDLKGRHGQAVLTGNAGFDPDAAPVLELHVDASDVALADDLRLALPDAYRAAWDELRPTGQLAGHCDVTWSPGDDVDVRLSDVRITDGSLLIQEFPYPLTDLVAELSFENDQAKIHSASARHDETTIRCEDGTVTLSANGGWNTLLKKLWVDDLQPDAGFRRTLPEELRSLIESVDPKGLISAAGEIELRHSGDVQEPVHFRWQMRTWLTGINVTPGVVLKDVHGRVDSLGVWTGGDPIVVGRLQLDSLDVFGYHVTDIKGDFKLQDGFVVMGQGNTVAPAAYEPAVATMSQIPEEPITGRAIDGAVTLDLFADLNQSETDYSLRLTLSRGDLESYAQRHLNGQTHLHGKMNGWVTLRGHGDREDRTTGRGQLQISPAALYELPVIVQVFSVLKFEPPERTAFNYAFIDFDIADARYNFRTIDLVGTSISLRGRGQMQFDGGISLDFYSTAGRGRGAIPLWSELVGQATRWYGVRVRGTAEAPVAEISVPQFDDALKRFLETFDPASRAPAPRIPLLNPNVTRRPADDAREPAAK